jgi:sec-independent protein translocase protein TatA
MTTTLAVISGSNMMIILVILLLMFGAKKLPELARGLGQAMKEFSKAKNDVADEIMREPAPTSQVVNQPAAPQIAQTVQPQQPVGTQAQNAPASVESAPVEPPKVA